MELQQQKKKDQEEAQFSDNNFWRIKTATEAELDVDELLRELEANEAEAQSSEEANKEEEDNSEQKEEEPSGE